MIEPMAAQQSLKSAAGIIDRGFTFLAQSGS